MHCHVCALLYGVKDVLKLTCVKVLCVCVYEGSSFVSNQVSSLQISIVCFTLCVYGGAAAGLMSTETTQFILLFLSKL